MRVGIDLGGTKIEAIALDESGVVLDRSRVATPQGDYHATVLCIKDLVQGLESRFGAGASVGVAAPGAISPDTGCLKNSNSVCLNGQALDRDISSALNRTIRIANDADCFTLSESIDGAGEGYGTVFGVILGTGTGGGISVNGHLMAGPNAIAGEWGHNPLPWPHSDELPGPECYCGKQGCIETFLSGPGLTVQHQLRSGQQLSAEQIVRRAGDGDHEAGLSLRHYQERLARALASVINIIDPHVIVLGGGLSNIDSLYQVVPEMWGHYVFSDYVRTHLVRALHGDSSGVRGAAWLWPGVMD